MIRRLKGFLGRFAVPGLIGYVLAFQAGFFLLGLFGQARSEWVDRMVLSADRVAAGEVWRLVTFLFIPPDDRPLFFVFYLYFTWMVGQGLERAWGVAGFNAYYLLGAALTVASAFLLDQPGRSVGNVHLHLSMFLAFARIHPDFTVLLFFILPVPIRYLGYLSWILLVLGLAAGDAASRLAIGAGIMNYLVFLGRGHWAQVADAARGAKRAPPSPRQATALRASTPVHLCAKCERTERDGRDLEFRVCPACAKEWCESHLKDHACQTP